MGSCLDSPEGTAYRSPGASEASPGKRIQPISNPARGGIEVWGGSVSALRGSWMCGAILGFRSCLAPPQATICRHYVAKRIRLLQTVAVPQSSKLMGSNKSGAWERGAPFKIPINIDSPARRVPSLWSEVGPRLVYPVPPLCFSTARKRPLRALVPREPATLARDSFAALG
jgi:hypothetical protein